MICLSVSACAVHFYILTVSPVFFMSLELFVFFFLLLFFYSFPLAITSNLFLIKCKYAALPPGSRGYNSKVLTLSDLKGFILMPEIPFTIGIASPGSSKG